MCRISVKEIVFLYTYYNNNNKKNQHTTHKTSYSTKENKNSSCCTSLSQPPTRRNSSSDDSCNLILVISASILTISGKRIISLMFLLQTTQLVIHQIIHTRTHNLELLINIIHANPPKLNLQLLVFNPPSPLPNVVDSTFGTTNYTRKQKTKT